MFLAAAALFLLYRVRGVLAPFILAFALSYLMNPVVTHLEKRGAPRGLGTLVIYVGFTLAITLFVLYLVPKFLVQLERLGEVLPQQAGSIQSEIAGFYKRFSRFNIPEPVKGAIDNGIDRAEEALAGFIERTLGSVPGLLPRLSLLILVPVLAFYLTMDFPELKMWLLSWIPDRWRSDIVGLMIEMDNSLGSFIRGQLLISAIVGVLIAVGLSIIGVDFALIIGLIAGIFNIVPYFGPVIGAIPAVISALLKSPLSAVYVVILFIVVNQVESSIISPNILGEHVGLHPVTVIFCIISGGYLFGILGVILAVPVTSIIKVTLRYIHNKLLQ
ncbi:MAG: AI-2E family transporter [Firmicutes bacterium]|nr:AI-2E family transporter [Bacillota bacterium]